MANVCVVLGSVREGRMGLRVSRCLVTSRLGSRLFGMAFMFLTVVAMYTLTIAMITLTRVAEVASLLARAKEAIRIFVQLLPP